MYVDFSRPKPLTRIRTYKNYAVMANVYIALAAMCESNLHHIHASIPTYSNKIRLPLI